MASQQPIYVEGLRCRVCKDQLTARDKQKTTKNYWKSCKSCRDKHNEASKRRKRWLYTSAVSKANSETKKKKPNLPDAERAIRRTTKIAPSKLESTAITSPESAVQSAASFPTSSTSLFWASLAKRHLQDFQNGAPTSITSQKNLGTSSIAATGFTYQPGDNASSSGEEWYERRYKQRHCASLDRAASSFTAKEKQKPSERECSVCANSSAIQDYPNLKACEHMPDVCHECFLQWLDQQMASTSWQQITCPSSGCNNPITHDDVKTHAPQDVFTRFDELSMRSFLSADKDFLYCLAPGCTSGQFHDTGVEGPIFRCATCNFRMCTAHTPVIPFHENETCTQYAERIAKEQAEREAREAKERQKREDQEASIAKVKQDSVECPGCRSNITKRSGCDHMTCRCGFEFCYKCQAPYKGTQGIRRVGNSAHKEGCPYHSSKLPRYQGAIY